jgi:hypothetical protein
MVPVPLQRPHPRTQVKKKKATDRSLRVLDKLLDITFNLDFPFPQSVEWRKFLVQGQDQLQACGQRHNGCWLTVVPVRWKQEALPASEFKIKSQMDKRREEEEDKRRVNGGERKKRVRNP